MNLRPAPLPTLGGYEPCTLDPDLFFPESHREELAAEPKRRCLGCHALDTCRDYALTHDVAGVWGGLTEQERRRFQRDNGLKVRKTA